MHAKNITYPRLSALARHSRPSLSLHWFVCVMKFEVQLTKWQSPESWGAEDKDDGPVQFDELAAQYKKGVVHLETYVWHKLL